MKWLQRRHPLSNLMPLQREGVETKMVIGEEPLIGTEEGPQTGTEEDLLTEMEEDLQTETEVDQQTVEAEEEAIGDSAEAMATEMAIGDQEEDIEDLPEAGVASEVEEEEEATLDMIGMQTDVISVGNMGIGQGHALKRLISPRDKVPGIDQPLGMTGPAQPEETTLSSETKNGRTEMTWKTMKWKTSPGKTSSYI